MTSRPLLTIAQVVEQFDVSRATVRRGIDNGRFPGATKDGQGRWAVPVEALVAGGIKPRKTWLNEHAHGGAHELAQGAQKVVEPLQALVATERAHSENERAHNASRIAQLEAELSAEKQLRAAAERNADDLRTALRMIEAAPSPAPEAATTQPRKRWWQRQPK